MSAINYSVPTTNFLLKIVFFLKLWIVFLGRWIINSWKLGLEYFDRFRPLVIIYLLVFIQVIAVIGSSRTNLWDSQPHNQEILDLIPSYFQTEAISLKTDLTSMNGSRKSEIEGQESEIISHQAPPSLDLAKFPLSPNIINPEFLQIHLTTTIQQDGFSYPVGRELLTKQALFYLNQGKFDLATKFLEAAKNVDPGWWGWK